MLAHIACGHGRGGLKVLVSVPVSARLAVALVATAAFRLRVSMQLRFMRRAVASACIVVVFAACGGDTLSLTEYSELFQSASFAVTDEFDVLEAEWALATTVEEGKEILERAVAIRTDMQNSLTDLDPPEALADFHGDIVEQLGRILAATEAWTVRAETAASLDELQTSSEALAYWDLDAEMHPLCLEFQSRLDATAERKIFAEVPWIPGDMKEVVSLVMGC
jgi:hypothetical protein